MPRSSRSNSASRPRAAGAAARRGHGRARNPRRGGGADDPSPLRFATAAPGQWRPPVAWYLDLSTRPLQILLFLAPLIVVYELGMIFYAPQTPGGVPVEISASRMLRDVYAIFDVSALHLPGITLVVVLLIWHVLRRDRWEAHLGLPLVMLLESILLAIPLIVIDQLMRRLAPASVPGGAGAASMASAAVAVLTPLMNDAPAALDQLAWQTRLVLSVGAGLYEELLFRMVVIAAAHSFFVDVLQAPGRVGAILGIMVSAATFTVYHDLTPGPAGELDIARALFLFLAGLYFAFLYVARGFGIVVGAHAAYDILATVVFPALATTR